MRFWFLFFIFALSNLSAEVAVEDCPGKSVAQSASFFKKAENRIREFFSSKSSADNSVDQEKRFTQDFKNQQYQSLQSVLSSKDFLQKTFDNSVTTQKVLKESGYILLSSILGFSTCLILHPKVMEDSIEEEQFLLGDAILTWGPTFALSSVGYYFLLKYLFRYFSIDKQATKKILLLEKIMENWEEISYDLPKDLNNILEPLYIRYLANQKSLDNLSDYEAFKIIESILHVCYKKTTDSGLDEELVNSDLQEDAFIDAVAENLDVAVQDLDPVIVDQIVEDLETVSQASNEAAENNKEKQSHGDKIYIRPNRLKSNPIKEKDGLMQDAIANLSKLDLKVMDDLISDAISSVDELQESLKVPKDNSLNSLFNEIKNLIARMSDRQRLFLIHLLEKAKDKIMGYVYENASDEDAEAVREIYNKLNDLQVANIALRGGPGDAKQEQGVVTPSIQGAVEVIERPNNVIIATQSQITHNESMFKYTIKRLLGAITSKATICCATSIILMSMLQGSLIVGLDGLQRVLAQYEEILNASSVLANATTGQLAAQAALVDAQTWNAAVSGGAGIITSILSYISPITMLPSLFSSAASIFVGFGG